MSNPVLCRVQPEAEAVTTESAINNVAASHRPACAPYWSYFKKIFYSSDKRGFHGDAMHTFCRSCARAVFILHVGANVYLADSHSTTQRHRPLRPLIDQNPFAHSLRPMDMMRPRLTFELAPGVAAMSDDVLVGFEDAV